VIADFFSTEQLLDEARLATGFVDFGGDDFTSEIDLLLEEFKLGKPTPAAQLALKGMLLRTMINRLAIVNDAKQFPEIATQEIEHPLFVVGLPRSGTTFLHGLLAQDPASRCPLEWEVARPSPPPEAASYATDPRIQQYRDEAPEDPELQKMHLHGAEYPSECGMILLHGLGNHTGIGSFFDVPNFAARWKRSAIQPFQWHKRFLQQLQYKNARQRWVLKYPVHLMNMADLFAVYPDARIVVTHRDPARIIPSVCSLVEFFRKRNYETVNKAALGAFELGIWTEGMQRFMAFRDQYENSHQFMDVSYQDVTSNPLQVVSDIYQHHEIDFTAEAKAAMNSWLGNYSQQSVTSKYGKHSYTPEQYGLTEELIHKTFAQYIEKYLPNCSH